MDPPREPDRRRRQQFVNEFAVFVSLPIIWDWKPKVDSEEREAHRRDTLRTALNLDQLIDERHVSLAYLKRVWIMSMEISPLLGPTDNMPNVEDARVEAWRAYCKAHALPVISLDSAKGLHLVCWAVVSGYEQLAKTIVRDGADLNLIDCYGRTALSYAAGCANVGLAHLFLVNDACRIPYVLSFRGSLLSNAIDADGNKLAQLLLFLLDTPGEIQTRWFLQAIRDDMFDLVHVLLSCGFDAKCGHPVLVASLPEMVASISTDLSLDFSQLSRIELDRPEDDDDDGIHVYSYTGTEHSCPLLAAVESGNEGTVLLLVQHGANPEESVAMGTMHRKRYITPLIYAIDYGYVSMVRLLLFLEVETALGCPRGERPLHNAAAFPIVSAHLSPEEIFAELHEGPRNAVEMARILLDHGEGIDRADEDGLTPLMIAVLKRRLDIVSFLIERGADLNIQTRSKRTSLAHAIGFCGKDSSWNEGIDLLLKHGAKFEAAGWFYEMAEGYNTTPDKMWHWCWPGTDAS